MRESRQTLRNVSLLGTLFVLAPFLLFFSGCGGSDNDPGSGPVTVSRPWILEGEFRLEPGLRATPEQVVILDVGYDTGDVVHRIPYRFEESASYEICIPEDEEHITEITLYDNASREVAHLNLDARCGEYVLGSGDYRMEVIHDGATVPAQSKRGFIYLAPSGLKHANAVRREGPEEASLSGAAPTSEAPYDGRILIPRASNGNFLKPSSSVNREGSEFCISNTWYNLFDLGYEDKSSLLYPACEEHSWCDLNVSFVLGDIGVYTIAANSPEAHNNNFTFQVEGNGVRKGGLLERFNNRFVPWDSHTYQLTTLWDREQWNMHSNTNPGIFLAASGELTRPHDLIPLYGFGLEVWEDSDGLSFTLGYNGLSLSLGDNDILQMSSTGPPERMRIDAMIGNPSCNLHNGEFALGAGEPGSGGPIPNCLIFHGSQGDLSAYTGGYGVSVNCILLGPETGAVLYSGTNFTGTSTVISHDTCLNQDLGENASIKVMTSRKLLITTKSCSYCDLTGVDLSSMDLGGYKIDHANLTSANLDCATLDGTDLSYSNLDSTSLDYSAQGCQVPDVQAANFSNASLKKATVKNVTFENKADGTSSDFSYADLSQAQLSTVTFSEAKMSHASFDSAQLSNVTFTDTDLSHASMQGATLHPTTFTNANCSYLNLSGASLTDVGFHGSGLNLAQVDFTSPSSLDNVTLDGNIGGASFHGMDLPTEVSDGKLTFTDQCIYGSSYSSRTDFSSATVDLKLFTQCGSPTGDSTTSTADCLGQIRYMNLDSATLQNVDLMTSSKASPLNLQGATLSNQDLSGLTLDYADLGCFDADICTDLSGTDLSSSSLKNVNLQGAKMLNANLDNSNLESANLNSASLGMDKKADSASASFTGAYMKNVNLSEVNGSGVSFDNVGFYSGTPGKCSSESWKNGDCATAVGASLNNTNFSGAYLNGVDFSGAVLTGVTFNGASMMATTFVNTNLGYDKFTGNPTNMDLALLGGADFSGVGDITGASFENAYGTRTGLTICLLISGDNTNFVDFGDKDNPGYCSTTTQCTSRKPGDWDCIMDSYNSATKWPPTDSHNICFDGSNGPCDGKWNTDQSPSQNNDLPTDCLPASQGKSCVRECTIFNPTCTNGNYADQKW